MKKFLLSIFVALVLLTNVFAQCPASIAVTSTNITTATCPSNGAFTINATVGTGATYQITAGPAGFPTGSQDSATFNTLLPGNYTVRVACQSNPAVFTTTTITVPSTYVQVAANSVVTNVCSANAPGGTITTTASGSSTPFTYAYWQGDPAAADGTLTYGSANTYTATAFGVYNIRTKDGCGVFVTQQVTVANPYPAGLCISGLSVGNNNLTCAQFQDSVWATIWLTDNVSAPGVDVDVYKNTGTCASPVQGTLLTTHHIANNNNAGMIIARGQNLICVVRSPCGTLCTYCYTYSPPGTISQNSQMAASGCVTPGDPITYTIRAQPNNNFIFPITFVIRNGVGDSVTSFTANSYADLPHDFNGLPSDTYTSTMTDACGYSVAQTFTPLSGPPNQLTVTTAFSFSGCTSIEGRTSLRIDVNGPMANLVNAVAKIIPPSPNLIGVLGTYANSAGGYDFRDVIPGATYYIEIDNQCGQKDTVTVVVPIDPQQILVKHTTATVQQLCGGTGNIVVDAAYNGWGGLSYEIKNSAGTVVATGTRPGGTYNNLPAGVYTIKTTILYCMDGDTSSFQVTVLANGSGPVVIKKLGIICEDALGVPMTTGSALISFIGARALKVEYKLSAAPETSYANYTLDSDGSETITGLLANTSYQIRVTDVCGNSAVTEISIGALSPLNTTNTAHPCVGSPYTLGVPDMIDATYTWKKNGVTVSTGREIYFPSYTAGDDGTYTCTVVIAGCVTRNVTVTINSTLCGLVLPIKLENFTAKTTTCNTVELHWKVSDASNFNRFEIERSTNGVSFQTIGSITYNATTNLYVFKDNNVTTGQYQYRLKMVDNNGKIKYSTVTVVKLNCNNKRELFIYPNPAKDKITIGGLQNGDQVTIYNSLGQLVQSKKATEYQLPINIEALASGMYYIVAINKNGEKISSQKLIK